MDEPPAINICIPTYKRNEYLDRLLSSIYDSANAPRPRLSIRVHIFDNNPQCGAECIYNKYRLLIEENQAIQLISYRGGVHNIGSQSNVLKCYTYGSMQGYRENHYCWVIGDDDTLSLGCIPSLASILGEEKAPALIITSRETGASPDRISQFAGKHASYRDLILAAHHSYPELPIHHTLISCNIVRCDIFDFVAAVRTRATRYSQMYGIMSGLQLCSNAIDKKCAIYVLTAGLADAPCSHFVIEEKDFGIYREIPFRWAEYFTWLRFMWGISPMQYDLKAALRSDAWPQ